MDILKKALVGTTLIMIGFFAADRLIALGLEHVVTSSQFRLSIAYRGGHSTDILALGNSRAVNAFHAPTLSKRLGQRVFHLGYNGMSMVVANAVLSDYLAHNAAPKMLLLEISNIGVKNDLLNGLSPYMGKSERLRALLAQDNPKLSYALQLSHLYRFNNELFLRAGYYWNRTDQYWINQGTMTAAQARQLPPKLESEGDNPYPIDGAGFKALRAIQQQCAEMNIQLVLVASPYLPQHLERWPSYDRWIGTLKTRLAQHAHLHDYSRLLKQPEDFADAIHMNQNGSQKLLESMISDGVFHSAE